MAFRALPPNPDSLRPMFMAPEVEEIKDNDVDEDQFYLQKIQELVDQKMAFFSRSSSSSSDHDRQEPKVVAVEDTKPTKKPSNRRPCSSSRSRSRSPTDDHDDDYDESKMKKQKHKKKIIPNKMYVRSPAVSNETTERLKKFVTEELNGSDVKLVIQKTLYASDLAKSQNRLNMPINQLETREFLTADEKQLLDGEGGSIEVPLLGPTMKLHGKPMTLAKWHMKTTSNYILKTHWNHFVEANNEDLTVNTMVQVWSFRRDEQLCLALVCIGRAY